MVKTLTTSRMGGLVVALGVGAAVATGHGVAAAEEPSPNDTTDTENPGEAREDDPKDEAEEPDTAEEVEPVGEEEPVEEEPPAEEEVHETPTADDVGPDPIPDDAVEEPEDVHDDLPVDELPVNEPDPAGGVAQPATTFDNPAPQQDAVIEPTSQAPEPPAVPDPQPPAPVQQPPAPIVVEETPEVLSIAVQDLVSAQPAAARQVAPAPAPPRPAGLIEGFVSGLMSLIGLDAATTAAPGLPATPGNPLAELAWAFFRRIEHTDDAPTVTPGVYGRTETGEIVGTVVGEDDDGPVTFTVAAQPGNGTVTITPEGTYVYTPNRELEQIGGTDSFVVAAEESGWDVDGIAGLVHDVVAVFAPRLAEALYPGGGDVTYERIYVQVSASNAAPTAESPLPLTFDTYTGTVSGTLTYSDPDGDPVTYSVVDGPVNGELEVAPDGSFVYTPTTSARYDVIAEDVRSTDSFTVAVTDGVATTMHNVKFSVPTARLVDHVVFDADESAATVAQAPSGGLVFFGTDDGVQSYDTQTGDVVSYDVDGVPSDIVVSPDGRYAYAALPGADKVAVVDTQTGAVTHIDVAGNPASIAISPDGTRIYTANLSDGSVAFVDPTGAAPEQRVVVGDLPNSIAATAEYVVVTSADDDTVMVVDLTDLSVETLAFVTVDPNFVVVSPDGKYAFVTSATESTITRLDLEEIQIDGVAVLDSFTTALAISPDGTAVYVATRQHEFISVLDAETFRPVNDYFPDFAAGSIAVAPDGTLYLTDIDGGADKAIPVRSPDPLWAVSTVMRPADTVPAPLVEPAPAPAPAPAPLSTTTSRYENTTPTMNPSPGNQGDDGVVTGDLNGFDADDDPLEYELAGAPAHGYVTINPDGTYVYTPNLVLARDGGDDTFWVSVSDGDDHLHGREDVIHDVVSIVSPGVAEALYPGGGHTYTQQVTVHVDPVVPPEPENHPPVGGGDSIDFVLFDDFAPGRVKSSLGFSDPDPGDTISRAVVNDAERGDVVLSKGEVVYTPTLAARLAAGATVGPDFDTFSVSVTDDDGLTVVSDYQVEVLAASAGMTQATTGGAPSDVVIAPNGKVIYAGTTGRLVIYNPTTGGKTEIVVENGVRSLAIDPETNQLYVAEVNSDEISVIDPDDGSLTGVLGAGNQPGSIAFSPDGDYLFIAHWNVPTVTMLQTVENRVATTALSDFGMDVAVSPGIEGIAYVTYEFSPHVAVVVDDYLTGELFVQDIPVSAPLTAAVVSPDDTTLYAVSPTTGEIVAIDLVVYTSTALYEPSSTPRAIALSPDGSVLVVGTDDGVEVFRTDTNEVMFVSNTGPVTAVAFNEDGTAFVSVGPERLSHYVLRPTL